MNPKTEEEIDEIKELVTENHQMLKNIQSAARWARFFTIFRWSVIIIGAFVGYYFLQPYIEKVQEIWLNLKEATDNFTGFFDFLN